MKKQILISLLLLSVFCVGISRAQNEKKPIYGIVLDNTGSMRMQLNVVISTGIEIVEQADERGTISVFNFETVKNPKTEMAQLVIGADWKQDKKPLENYINGLYAVGGRTTLIDAILFSGETLNKKAETEKDKAGEKILVLVTDGEDRISKTKPQQLIKFLKDSEIKIFAIGLVEELENEGAFDIQSSKSKSRDFLKKLAKETGGNVIFPKGKQTIKDAVKSLFTGNIKDSK